ncbi:trypsin-like serine peptidase [Aliiruegeria lutimaris]|uniref:Trypsin n=1 Tax=Aliiruegeria lutimaris TaxID=571298 RepID=A0A1G8QIE4_9RHOB|nr:S1 family peptidase [Aliiruegeria lutimaris]SDJ04441.1 Trypsin [Aliiruegeria lutimaris]
MRAAKTILLALTLLPVMGGGISAKSTRQFDSFPGETAVGRLIVSGNAMCTGALVSPDTVLTAAHCLYDPRSGRRVDPKKIEFQAGLKQGQASAVRKVASAKEHPDYRHRKGNAQLGNDLALLRLQSPISSETVLPLDFNPGLERGDALAVMSYTLGNKSNPIMEYPCMVLARELQTLVMSCEVDYGASGAPVIALNKGNRPAVVSVVSAKAAMNGKKVSVGTTLSASTLRLMSGG